ncbi:peptidase family protein [Halobacteroides halobius DSM 5150]|uniref:Peptidase family protein n=1 Tax=Halobacteroides halobius (strain ATCC 35273 / DSM 5150 / MD-1) TaxID=748449 RepID=L0K7T5_HALHC|nr:M42 family metallopeptidase [Halobacteroides halobius]AGB41317.1 peptidase family protein [Halobacteroides halobius DSM 5150]
MKELVKKLVETYGPAGDEEEISRVIQTEIEDYVDQISKDPMGNLIALKKGQSADKKVMLAAHMDEIGLIATHIDDDGFIRFSNVGGVSPHTLIGERVLFNGETVGVVDKEGKLEKISDLKNSKMYIDIGASSKEEAKKKVKIGDTASYYRNLNDLGDRITAKSLDDRTGCAVLIKTLKELDQPTYDTYFVFTVQEEVGTRGSKVSAYGINPDLGIAVDVTLTGDMPEAKRMAVSLGAGPAIKVKDATVLANPQVKEMMVKLAKKNEIPYQLEVLKRGGTDTGSIQLTRDGVLAGALSIPARHVHSPSEMVDINDLKNSVQLLRKILVSNYNNLI